MHKYIMTWDLGATKCAASLVYYDKQSESFSCHRKTAIKLSSCHSLEELIQQIETGLDCSLVDMDAICIGAAGHYDGTCLQHGTGYPYPMNFAEVAKSQQWPPFAVIHDYSTIVCATFTEYMENQHNIKRLNHHEINKYGRRVALGVGTGLGLKDGVLFKNGEFWLGENEFGHAGIVTPPLASENDRKRHHEFMHFLLTDSVLKPSESVSFEKVLSGKGIVRLYRFFYPNASEDTPEIIGTKLSHGQANEVRSLFAWYLGLFVGGVQLAFMPEGGIWMTGGVILKHPEIFDHPEFFRGVAASPAYLNKRDSFPLGVLCNPEHAFMGAAYYAIKTNLI